MKQIAIPMEELMPLLQLQMETGGSARLTVTGSSMMPMLRDRKDQVFLEPITGPLKKGDLPLYRRTDGTGNEYNMLPLHIENADSWMEDFNMKEHTVTAAKNSHARTMAIVSEGLTECQTYLQESYEQREQYYYDLAFFPEKFAAEATEAPTEAVTEATVPAV